MVTNRVSGRSNPDLAASSVVRHSAKFDSFAPILLRRLQSLTRAPIMQFCPRA